LSGSWQVYRGKSPHGRCWTGGGRSGCWPTTRKGGAAQVVLPGGGAAGGLRSAAFAALTQDLHLPDDTAGFAEILINAIRAVAEAIEAIATAVAFLLVAAA
jgi:hypothetical protein